MNDIHEEGKIESSTQGGDAIGRQATIRTSGRHVAGGGLEEDGSAPTCSYLQDFHVALKAERDHLAQLLSELLGAVEEHRELWQGDGRPVRNEALSSVWNQDQALYATAYKVLKEMGK